MNKNQHKKALVFAMTGARALFGGIANANLNVLQALIEIVNAGNANLMIYSFLEIENDRPDFVPEGVRFKGFNGNKLRFVVSLLGLTKRRPVFCFDHVRLALPLLPLMRGGLIKTVIFAHGSESWKRLRAGNRAAFRSASLCITNSHFTLKKMREKISKFQGVACPLGLSPEFPLNIEIPQKHFSHMELTAADGRTRTLSNRIILLVARMDQKEGQKGHRALINIMPKLLEEFPEAQLVFPGPGDDTRNLQKLAESIGIAPSVFLPGFVSAEVLGCLYRRCYMFAMPSKQEGFGLAYLEAMNYAKPCIGCFNQGAEDVIIDGETGFLIHDPNDPAELLRVIRTLLQEPERARTFGIAGFNRLHEHFTSSQYQNRVKEQIAKFL